jgi:hypothetical protein
MTKQSGTRERRYLSASGKYRQVKVASLDKGRKGKHHDLVAGILDELRTAKPGAALVIPLDEVGGIGLTNLRSAVHRAAGSAGIKIQTLADDANFYVWSGESKTEERLMK